MGKILSKQGFKSFAGLVLLCWGSLGYAGQKMLPYAGFVGIDADTLSWEDGQGKHLLLLEQLIPVWNEEEGTTSQTIRATHWLQEGERRKELWVFEDSVEDCPVDLEAQFQAAPRLTDLDKDGVYEVWLITQKACKGDVSPSQVEVILMDKEVEPRRLIAEQLLVFPDGTTDGGAFELHDFSQLPKAYQEYAVEYLLANYRFEYQSK